MSDRPIVKPQPVSGFPEWLPEEKLVEERLLGLIRRAFERYGFTPVETPAIERKEVLHAKGVVDKEIYALSRLAAGEGQDPATELALHFDLTVPLARYVAQHFARLTFPFRRHQIQKVWRGERPQAGRFREFYQCDIDVIGNGSLSLLADAELPLVINDIFAEMKQLPGMNMGDFKVRLNNRKLLQGILQSRGIDPAQHIEVLRIIDKLEKVGRGGVVQELKDHFSISASTADNVVEDIHLDLDVLQTRGRTPLFQEGVQELTEVKNAMRYLGMPEDTFEIDLKIARGLDYYTGTVYETVLTDHPQIGSICSGGRYDDLAGTFTKQRLPGVGISIGLTRLLSRLFDAGLLKPGAATPAHVLVTVMDRQFLADYLALAADLRGAGLNVEVYTQGKRIGDQLKYADRKGFPVAVIAGEAELAAGTVNVKTLATGDQATVPRTGLIEAVKARMGGG